MSQVRDQDERQVRSYHRRIRSAHLLSADRTRRLTPREIVFVLLRGGRGPEYVHAVRRTDLPESVR